VAKAGPETGATFYVAEGGQVPDDLPEGVRPVGPGAAVPDDPEPEPESEEPDPTPEPPRPVSKPKPSLPVSSGPADEG
jgi:hypothetical protein